MDRRCGFLHCGEPSVATLGDYEYCLVHFILACYRHLEQSSGLRHGDPEHEGKAEERTRSLVEIIDQVTSVGLTTGDLTNQERGQLLDILLWTSGLLSDGRK